MANSQNNSMHYKVRSIETLFDHGDSENLVSGKLNPDWLEYLFENMPDKGRNFPFHLTLKIPREILKEENREKFKDGLHEKFWEYEKILNGKLKKNFRNGRITLGFGIITLGIFMALSKLVYLADFLGAFKQAFQEGFLIIGWVALWRPVEILLYDWWPIVEERMKIRRLAKGKITIETL